MKTSKIYAQISQKGKILFVKADQNYSIFYLENGVQITSGYTLKFHEDQLDSPDFIRVNRSIIVHKSFVQFIKETHKASYAILKDGRNVLIPRRKLRAFQKQYFGV